MIPVARGVLLGIDFGRRRTGFARSDPAQSVAFGLPTLLGPAQASLFSRRGPHARLVLHLADLFHESPWSSVVCGWPLHEDGTEGTMATTVRSFAEWLSAAYAVPVYLWNEFGTSAEALALLDLAPARIRRDRARVDRLAAQRILQGFLDRNPDFELEVIPPPPTRGCVSDMKGPELS